MRTLPQIAAGCALDGAAVPVDGADASVPLTSRTPGTPLAADGVGSDPAAALAAFAGGARVIELDAPELALRAAVALDLLRASGRMPFGEAFAEAFFVVRLPDERAAAEAALDKVAGSTADRFDLAAELSAEEAAALGHTRPLTAVTLPVSRGLDADTEAFATAILREWGDDLVLGFGTGTPPGGIADALGRLRAAAESAGCTLLVKVPEGAPGPLLAALADSAGAGVPVWRAGVAPAEVPRAFARGATLVSPASAADLPAAWRALTDALTRLRARRASDLVLFAGVPDAALEAAGREMFGPDWFCAPAKNSLLALHRLREAAGEPPVDSALTAQALAAPPPDCCLYQEAVPDLFEAATGWLYSLWVRESIRRRLVE